MDSIKDSTAVQVLESVLRSTADDGSVPLQPVVFQRDEVMLPEDTFVDQLKLNATLKRLTSLSSSEFKT